MPRGARAERTQGPGGQIPLRLHHEHRQRPSPDVRRGDGRGRWAESRLSRSDTGTSPLFMTYEGGDPHEGLCL